MLALALAKKCMQVGDEAVMRLVALQRTQAGDHLCVVEHQIGISRCLQLLTPSSSVTMKTHEGTSSGKKRYIRDR